MPVLPEVASTMTEPGTRIPRRSASRIMATPIRSLTEEHGFLDSILPSRMASTSAPIRRRRMSGVPPTVSTTLSKIGIGGALKHKAVAETRRLGGVQERKELLELLLALLEDPLLVIVGGGHAVLADALIGLLELFLDERLEALGWPTARLEAAVDEEGRGSTDAEALHELHVLL